MSSSWDAGCHPGMLSRGSSHPCGIEPAGRKCYTVMPVLFQLCQTFSFTLWLVTRYRHVALGFRSTTPCDVPPRVYCKCNAGETEEQCEQRTEVNEPVFAEPPLSRSHRSAASQEATTGIRGASG